MPAPTNPKMPHQKSRVDQVIDNFAQLEKPTIADLNKVLTTAQVEAGLETYRAQARSMAIIELQNEKHISARLAGHLEQSGDPRPNTHCHAHAIISGGHPDAVKLRAVIAWVKMRIDDAHNGCWLPQNTAAKAHMPERLRHAVPHSRIHRFNYYFWLNSRITLQQTPNFEKLSTTLALIAKQLQEHTFPPFVMAKKGEELPA